MSSEQPIWNEADSEQFLRFSEIITPARSEQVAVLGDLIPAEQQEAFQLVELGCGGGVMAASLLERFPHARYLGLDGSPTMLRATAERLRPGAGRTDLREFRLEQQEAWCATLPRPIRCVFSSLVVHHLPDAEKRGLYGRIHGLLEPGGAFLLVDIVLPSAQRGRMAVGRNWDAVVRQQSEAATDSLGAYETFKQGGWNCYSDPDPMDLPAPLFTQMQWLAEAGFRDVDCFWQRGGHALFGGYK